MTNDDQNHSTDIQVRRLQKTDLESIVRLERQVFGDPWPRSAFEDHLEQPNWGGFVALSDNIIVGYGCWMIVAEEGHLTNIAVAEAFRRKSVAQHLLQPILEVTKGQSCQFILLEVRPSNEGAIAFYKNNGFEVLYRRPSYYHNPVEDALVMVKYFDT